MLFRITAKMSRKQRQKSSAPAQQQHRAAASSSSSSSTQAAPSSTASTPPPTSIVPTTERPPSFAPPPSPHLPALPDYDELSIDLEPPPYSRYASSVRSRRARRNSVSSSMRRVPYGSTAGPARPRPRTRPITQNRRVTADHPVWEMTVDEQVRLRRMGIDPVIKAEFMQMRRGSPA